MLRWMAAALALCVGSAALAQDFGASLPDPPVRVAVIGDSNVAFTAHQLATAGARIGETPRVAYDLLAVVPGLAVEDVLGNVEAVLDAGTDYQGALVNLGGNDIVRDRFGPEFTLADFQAEALQLVADLQPLHVHWVGVPAAPGLSPLGVAAVNISIACAALPETPVESLCSMFGLVQGIEELTYVPPPQGATFKDPVHYSDATALELWEGVTETFVEEE